MSLREGKYGCWHLGTIFLEECLDITDKETQQVEEVFIEELHNFLRFDRYYWNGQTVTDLVENFKVRYQIGNIGLAGRIR
jgi:hypothetical protein